MRVLAVVLAVVGVLFAAYVEYGTPRAADVERSFGWFAFEAGPYVVALVLAMFSPYSRALVVATIAMLALEGYAYYTVFVLPLTEDAPLVYLHKPLYEFGIVAVAMFAGFLRARSRERR
jgi:hypothetical protein